MKPIPTELHTRHSWRVFPLIEDFQLQDVWRFPLEDKGDPAEGFTRFRESFTLAMERLTRRGPVGFLFRLRYVLGKIFRWDSEKAAAPNLGKNSLSHRYLQQVGPDLSRAGIPEKTVAKDGFHAVYILEREMLSEIANKTVHAALHLSWPQIEEGVYTAHMAVYVKSTGRFTDCYMALIKPFRHFIVYPAMLRTTAKFWHALSKDSGGEA